ncbi:MAG: DUF1049 domain-containing protein [Cyanobacteria bacterium QS_8_64_29]|nr:MAG: DUF1049 domain-containing protein [Cyanobacteria bacterium QS_8_64_29]
MRQINFALIFAIGLGLVLFSLENTEPTVIQVVPGYQVQAPLAIELIFAMGIGAVLAWLFSIWNRLQRQVDLLRQRRQLRQKDRKIEDLEQDLQGYKIELEQQRKLPPSEGDQADGENQTQAVAQ